MAGVPRKASGCTNRSVVAPRNPGGCTSYSVVAPRNPGGCTGRVAGVPRKADGCTNLASEAPRKPSWCTGGEPWLFSCWYARRHFSASSSRFWYTPQYFSAFPRPHRMGKPKTWYTSGIFSTRNLRFGTEGKFLRRLALRAPLVRPRFPGPPRPFRLRSPTAFRCPAAQPDAPPLLAD